LTNGDQTPFNGCAITMRDEVFFANQGEFTTDDYEEIMNKASALSLISNAIV
jgi:TnpA family transposase